MGSVLIAGLLQEASLPGEEIEPTELVVAVTEGDPFAAIGGWETAFELFAALDRGFPFINRVKAGSPLSEGERARWTSMLRWWIGQLRHWDPKSDDKGRRLSSLLVIAQAHDWDGALWRALPTDALLNVGRTGLFANIAGGLEMTFGTRGGEAEPIWERNAVDTLLAAEAACDWSSLGEVWRPFQDLLHPTPLQIQAIRFLAHIDMARLVAAVAGIKQLAAAMLVAQVLDVEPRLELASASENHFVEFACAYETFNGRRKRPPAPLPQAALLSRLLRKVADDGPRWRGWMDVFNAYPIRYPALHPCLGEALATAPRAAIEAYVDSMRLSPQPHDRIDEGRRNVAACLRVFRDLASDEQRRLLWARAHDRWSEWAFDAANEDAHLLGISRSEIDYAVVGFAVECLDDAGKAEMLAAMTSRLAMIEDSWHASGTDIRTAWFRALSCFQPYAHATYLGPTDDWLPESHACYPPEIADDAFFALRYPAT
ncbi:hypothetical protein V1282_003558 [Nitrobacteraceae bacterium AZCC 2146]